MKELRELKVNELITLTLEKGLFDRYGEINEYYGKELHQKHSDYP